MYLHLGALRRGVAIAAVAIALAVTGSAAGNARETRCYRIAYESSQPYHFADPAGGPAGPAVGG